VRDARGVQRRLEEALQQLEGDPGAAAGIAALVAEVEVALADTGPLEVGVPAERLVAAVEAAEKVRARLQGVDAVMRRRQIVRALRELRGLFKRAAATARARDRAPARRRLNRVGMVVGWGAVAAILASGFVFALSGAFGDPAVQFAAWSAIVAMITALCETSTRVEMIARNVMVVARPGERLLLCQGPTNLGDMLARRVWIATDQRLFLADRARRGRPAQIVRSVEYGRITALSHRDVGEGRVRIALSLGSERLEFGLDAASGKAFLVILCRRTGLPALPPLARRTEWRARVGVILRRWRGF